MRIIDISGYSNGLNMLGITINPNNSHIFFTRQGQGDNLWEINSNGGLVSSYVMNNNGINYGGPSSLAITQNNHLITTRPVYDSQYNNVIDAHLVEMSLDAQNIFSSFHTSLYEHGGSGLGCFGSTANILISSFADKAVYEVSPDGVLIDYFKVRATPIDIAIDPTTENIFVAYQGGNAEEQYFSTVFDEYKRIDFRKYILVNTYALNSVGLTRSPMCFDINRQDGLFYALENNARILEFGKSELTLAPPNEAIFKIGRTANSVSDNWSNVNFDTSFYSPPTVVASIDTFDGADTAGLRMNNISNNGLSIKIEEEQSGDSEISHTSEVVSYLAASTGPIHDHLGNHIGEVGKLDANQADGNQWHTVNLNTTYHDPVVIMQLMSFRGSQPAHTRLRNITEGSFEYQIEEWDYEDQVHTNETIGYIVIENRKHQLLDGTVIQAGKVDTNHEWANIQFDTSLFHYSTPVLVSHCQTFNGPQAVVTRQITKSAFEFDLRLQEEERNDGYHVVETVGYVAAHQ